MDKASTIGVDTDGEWSVLEDGLRLFFGVGPEENLGSLGLTGAIEIRHLAVGEGLMTQGDPSDAMYLLLSGRLYAVADGRVLGEIRTGETVGEMGLISGEPRFATVRAARDSTVARIDAENFRTLLEQRPSVGLSVARTMIARQRAAADPRRPQFVPDRLCLVPLTPGLDVRAVALALAATGVRHAEIFEPRSDPAAIESARREGRVTLVCADPSDDALFELALGEGDEIVMVADATADPGPGGMDHRLAARLPDAPLPRRTLLLMHPPETQSPRDTARWFIGRRVDRHLHMRIGRKADECRVARVLFGAAIGIALAGGGARGAAHLGALRALAEQGIEPDIVGGTSIGAAMAALYAQGLRGDALDRAAKAIFVDEGSPTSDWTLAPLVSLIKGDKTRRLCKAAIRDASGGDIGIEDCWTTFFCIAGDFTRQRQAVLSSGALWRALQATYAIPGVLPPVVIDGSLHVDGGVVNNMPVDVLESFDVTHTIAVDLLGGTMRKVEIEDMPTGWQLLRDRFRPRKSRRYRVPGTINTLLSATVMSSFERQRAMRERADLCLRPELPRIGLLDWKKFEEIIELGYDSCAAQLAAEDDATLDRFRARPSSPDPMKSPPR